MKMALRNVFLASNCFRKVGRRFAPGSVGVECDVSQGCCSAWSAVMRAVWSTVRQHLMKSRAEEQELVRWRGMKRENCKLTL